MEYSYDSEEQRESEIKKMMNDKDLHLKVFKIKYILK
jgi:hypothetical protein